MLCIEGHVAGSFNTNSTICYELWPKGKSDFASEWSSPGSSAKRYCTFSEPHSIVPSFSLPVTWIAICAISNGLFLKCGRYCIFRIECIWLQFGHVGFMPKIHCKLFVFIESHTRRMTTIQSIFIDINNLARSFMHRICQIIGILLCKDDSISVKFGNKRIFIYTCCDVMRKSECTKNKKKTHTHNSKPL